MLSWLITYPIDVIKTRIQSEKYNLKNALSKGKFNHGLSYCLLRSFIVNGFSFLVYENFSLKKK